jgi:YD repeat-containing protein
VGDSIPSSGRFTQTGPQSGSGTYTANVHIDGVESITTAAGRFKDALRVTQTIAHTATVNGQTFSYTFTDVRWLVNGVGEVKLSESNSVSSPPFQISLDLSYSSLLENLSKDDGDCDCGTLAGDPIHLGTGNSLQREIDYALAQSPLRLDRIYNSRSVVATSYGYNWRHGYDHRIVYLSGTSPRRVLVQRADGKKLGFHEDPATVVNGQPVWLADDPDVDGKLSATASVMTNDVSVPSAWQYIAPNDDFERYDSSGQLASIVTVQGRSFAFTYASRLTTVPTPHSGTVLTAITDAFGRGFNLGYDSSLRIASVGDAGGTLVTYGYEPDGNLTSAGYADGSSRRYAYNEATHTGGGGSLPRALTSLSDENGQVYASWNFDTLGRATRSQLAGGANRIDVAYPADGTTTVTDALAQQRSISYSRVNAVTKIIAMSAPGARTIRSGDAARTYDAAGNITSRTDFNRNVGCYGYDLLRNLQTSRIEGLPNTSACVSVLDGNASILWGARRISTQWHPDWHLPVHVAQPGRFVTLVYNGQPDPFKANALATCAPSGAALPNGKPIAVLCKEVGQATTDADGHLGFNAVVQAGVATRTQQWTYNQYGQVLTAKDPLNNTTTYTYYADTTADHTMGDLQSVTNAVGKITTYVKYDKHGNVLQTTDANGVVTTNIYDLRQRLLSTIVGTEKTSYTYDLAGQLITATLPNGASITNTYDAAHRLTQVADAGGNKVVYTLDNAGNRIGEQVQDASGTLVRNIARSYDALNRLQSSSGAAR